MSILSVILKHEISGLNENFNEMSENVISDIVLTLLTSGKCPQLYQKHHGLLVKKCFTSHSADFNHNFRYKTTKCYSK